MNIISQIILAAGIVTASFTTDKLSSEKKLIEEISSSEILEMINNETITEGMIPRLIHV